MFPGASPLLLDFPVDNLHGISIFLTDDEINSDAVAGGSLNPGPLVPFADQLRQLRLCFLSGVEQLLGSETLAFFLRVADTM